jgi:hypothetical protein
MTMKRMTGVALMLGILPLSAVSLGAAEINGAGDAADIEVNVTNHSWTRVQVYAEDARGDLHFLGGVAREQFELYEIPGEVADLGEFRIRVYPQQFDARPAHSTGGVKTQPLSPQDGELVILLLEQDLPSSKVLFDKG